MNLLNLSRIFVAEVMGNFVHNLLFDRWKLVAKNNGVYEAAYLIDLRYDPKELREEEFKSAKEFFQTFV